eukprot:gene11095-23195_t
MSEIGFGGSVSGTVVDFNGSDHSDKLKNNKKLLLSKQSSVKKAKVSKNEDSKTEVFGAKVMLKHGFGSNALPVDGIQSFSTLLGEKELNDRLVYRIGRHLCVHDPETGRQQYFTGRPKETVNVLHFAISQNARYISICETVRNDRDSDEGHSQASIYSLTSFIRQKTLVQPSNTEFIASCFCGDSKYIITLSDEPDKMIILWQWEKERICKTASLSVRATRLCAAPAFVQVSVSGPGYLKCWHLGPDGSLKMSSLLPTAKEGEHFIDHIWLTCTDARRVAVLTDSEGLDGQSRRQCVLVFEGTDAAAASTSAHTSTAPPIPLELRQTIPLRLDHGGSGNGNGVTKGIRLIAYSKGFILLGTGGYLTFFEKTEDKKEPYSDFRTLSLGKESIISGTVLPSEDKMVVLTDSSALLTLPLGNIDVVTTTTTTNNTTTTSNNNNNINISQESRGGGGRGSGSGDTIIGGSDLTFGGFHKSAVLSVDMAEQRPSLITIAQ